MGTTLQEGRAWVRVISPNPAEPVRAGGGIGLPITIPGDGGDPDGGVTYTPLVSNVRIRHLGGVSKTLAVDSVVGNDITVQLGTDAGGNPTSTADDVATVVGADAAAAALVSVGVTGDGGGTAGIATVWTTLAAGVQGSIRTGLQNLTDRSRHLVEQAATWNAYGANLESFDGAIVTVRIDSLYEPHDAVSITPAGLAADTWYYCYARIDTSPVLEASTTGPDLRRRAKTGDGQSRYVGCFRTNGAATIRPFSAERGEYLYDLDPEVGGLTLDGVWHTVSVAAYVPPHVRRVTVAANVAVDVGAAAYLQVRRPGSAGDGRRVGACPVSSSGFFDGHAQVTLNGDRELQYLGVGNMGTLTVVGFQE